MIKEYFKTWNLFEKGLCFISVITILAVGIIFQSDKIAIVESIVMVLTAILQAKGKIESQFFSLLDCFLYSYLSYKSRYFGEVIFYLLIMFPMAIMGIISWMKHKSDKTDTVEVNEIKAKEWGRLVVVSIIAFVGLYYLLRFFDTSQLIVSTFSMVISMLAVYLLVRRSKYSFLFYILNDIILIILWALPVIAGEFLLIPMMIGPIALLISDTYGTINWGKMEKEQKEI